MDKRLIQAVAAVGAGIKTAIDGPNTVFQAVGRTTSGVGAASINIEVSVDQSNWILAGNITLTLGTSDTSDGFTMAASWPYCRANVLSISGTGANVDAWAGR